MMMFLSMGSVKQLQSQVWTRKPDERCEASIRFDLLLSLRDDFDGEINGVEKADQHRPVGL